jgi:ELWxxDGT repeat protein
MHYKYLLRKGRPGSLRWFSVLFSLICPLALAQPGLVKDINPGAVSSDPYSQDPHRPGRAYASLGNTFYFTANNGTNGIELWKSDGTAAGTTLVKDIYPGPGSANPAQLTNMNGTLYFTADDGVSGYELWKSDGTAAGTVRVVDLNPGPGNTAIHDLEPINGTLYFTTGYTSTPSANDSKLFKTNGTAAGTVAITDAAGQLQYRMPGVLAQLNGQLLFFAAVDGDFGTEFELWKSNGTSAGTALIAEGISSPYEAISGFVRSGNLLYFSTFFNRMNVLWQTDGMSVNEVSVGGGRFETTDQLTDINGTLYFVEYGTQILKTNGTPETTSRVAYFPYEGPAPTYLTNVNGTLFFVVGNDLHKSNGAGSSLVRSFSTRPTALTNVNGTLYLAADNGTSGTELWKSDGTPAGTTLAADINPGLVSSNPKGLFNLNGTLFFDATTAAYGTEFWKLNTVATPTTTFRINAGGAAFAASGSRPFAADGYFTGGKPAAAVAGDVANTSDDALYRDGRFGDAFSYNLPTGNGSFDVTLHFAETYWGNGRSGGVGSRKFNVNLEGVRKLTDYDIFAKAGGAMRAVRETFTVKVVDGTLNIAFLKGLADLPRVEAIEVVPTPAATFYRAINLGGDPVTLDGNAWGGRSAANYTTNGGSFTNTNEGVVLMPGTDAVRESMIRSSVWRYTNLQLNLTAVPAGTYQVYLYVWEDNAAETYSILLEGKTVRSNYNSSYAGTWQKLGPFQASITDGTISLATTGGAVNFSGVEVWKVNTAATAPAREATLAATESEAFPVKLYPNPVQDRLSVQLPFDVGQVRGTSVADAAGNPRLLNTHAVSGAGELEIRTEGLQPGFYLLKLDTGLGFKVVKFIKQ